MKTVSTLAALAVAATMAAPASAALLRLDSYTATLQTANVSSSLINAGGGSNFNALGATGFNMTAVNDDLEYAPGKKLDSFVAWCVDIAHSLIGVGNSHNYEVTETPFSNSNGLTALAKTRLSALFNQFYDTIDVRDADQAAAWQIAVWEAAFETSSNMSLSSGDFQASSTGSTALASNMLAVTSSAMSSSSVAEKYRLVYLESDGNVGRNFSQNLVTVAPVPLPAAGILMLGGLAGFAAVSRRRKTKS